MRRKVNTVKEVPEAVKEILEGPSEELEPVNINPDGGLTVVYCGEWNPLFGISGALADITCKLNEDHEGEHEVTVTLGKNPRIQNIVRWMAV